MRFMHDDCVVADGPGNDYGAAVPKTPVNDPVWQRGSRRAVALLVWGVEPAPRHYLPSLW